MKREPPFILVVEDHDRIRANTTWQLRQEGFAVQEAESPAAAVELMRLQPELPDMLLVDVRFRRATASTS